MKKFCLALLTCSSFFCAYGMNSDDDDFGGRRLTDEEAKKAGMLTSVEIAQYAFAQAMAPATLDGWVTQVHHHQETDAVQEHLAYLFSNLHAIATNIERKNFDEAYKAFQHVATLRAQVKEFQAKHPALSNLLSTAYSNHLEPSKTPFIAVFAQAKKKVFQNQIDPQTLPKAQKQLLVRQAWNQCTRELKDETEMRFSRVVSAGAALNKCKPTEWMEIAKTQVALQSKKQTQNSSCSLQ